MDRKRVVVVRGIRRFAEALQGVLGGSQGGTGPSRKGTSVGVARPVVGLVALRGRNRLAAVPAGLLAVACLVSLASGFFDGGLGDASDLLR